jgi:hypothetical protein
VRRLGSLVKLETCLIPLAVGSWCVRPAAAGSCATVIPTVVRCAAASSGSSQTGGPSVKTPCAGRGRLFPDDAGRLQAETLSVAAEVGEQRLAERDHVGRLQSQRLFVGSGFEREVTLSYRCQTLGSSAATGRLAVPFGFVLVASIVLLAIPLQTRDSGVQRFAGPAASAGRVVRAATELARSAGTTKAQRPHSRPLYVSSAAAGPVVLLPLSQAPITRLPQSR